MTRQSAACRRSTRSTPSAVNAAIEEGRDDLVQDLAAQYPDHAAEIIGGASRA